ncbi:MAG: hypothetical protein ABI433_07230 [Burkholderiaceae bacterium]
MTRRLDLTTADMFGFDPIGADFTSSAQERAALFGLSCLAIALYYACLKPFAKGNGRVYAQSYYRLAQVLTHRRAHSRGVLTEVPTKKVLRGGLDALEQAGLVIRPKAENTQKGILQIWLVHGVGGTLGDSRRAGKRAGSKTAATRMNA